MDGTAKEAVLPFVLGDTLSGRCLTPHKMLGLFSSVLTALTGSGRCSGGRQSSFSALPGEIPSLASEIECEQVSYLETLFFVIIISELQGTLTDHHQVQPLSRTPCGESNAQPCSQRPQPRSYPVLSQAMWRGHLFHVPVATVLEWPSLAHQSLSPLTWRTGSALWSLVC